MTIVDVQDVVTDAGRGLKFIVANVTDASGAEKLVIRSDSFSVYHKDLFLQLRRELNSSDLLARCIGGGYILIDRKNRTIHICDESGEYGREPDRKRTVSMLQKAFPDFEIVSLEDN